MEPTEGEYRNVERADFLEGAWGRLVRTPQGAWATVPRPLPPDIAPSWELVARLSEAERALAELAGVARNLPNLDLLIRPFVRREAVLSSRIEGTQAALSDLFFFEAAHPERPEFPDVREVANYVQALEFGLDRLSSLPLSLRLIRELHALLLEGVRGNQLTPGEFRRQQNWIGPPGCSLGDATFVPPPLPEMQEALEGLEQFLHAESPLPALLRMALIHYQFEAIHPFLDGNGRVGRLLLSLLLCHEQLLPQPLLYLSAFFERHREDYYRLLLAVSQKGAWPDWLDFFLRGVGTEARDAVVRIHRLLDLRDGYRRRLGEARSPALLLRLVDELFARPFFTVGEVARRLNVTHRTAAQLIAKLEQPGLVREVTGQKRNRVFAALEVLAALEG